MKLSSVLSPFLPFEGGYVTPITASTIIRRAPSESPTPIRRVPYESPGTIRRIPRESESVIRRTS